MPSGFRVVSIDQLRPGMKIHDLRKSWLGHSFWRRRFVIEDEATIERLRQDSILEVVIDVSRGQDVGSVAPRPMQNEKASRSDAAGLRQVLADLPPAEHAARPVSVDEERRRMRFLRQESLAAARELLEDVRIGRQLDIQRVEPLVERMFGSVNRHFRENLLQAFTRTVGIYPVGSLVRLDNGYLAAVVKVYRNNLLKPKLQVIFDTQRNCHVQPMLISSLVQGGASTRIALQPFELGGARLLAPQ
ncbi:uncharacterized protein DUF3391 [Azonexus fungiphilus]|uniref:Uncharacterized protein DUF3391 n=1 Tax=Azonexus fungiphilus TaxID=146940 RepID=A0A495WNN5_9RHOO|nr:DUF3391 domain-containing protein [Azonexus fungiphilus]RKT62950.1 uncharacterized protein DUF3391 [Azonexus fungiphilus]